ncbi:MAG: hypothetical protein ACXVEZ_11090 [Nocardioidaceae bacterium]
MTTNRTEVRPGGTVASSHRAERSTRGGAARRWTTIGGVIVVLLAATGISGLVGAHLLHDDAPGAAPYVDPASAGTLTLCRDGVPVTSGSTVDQPFVDLIVGGQVATGGYASGGTAALFAYQPRADVGPDSWSGLQLGAAYQVTDPATPRTTLAATDTTLAQFLTAYPSQDDGWLQLRLVLGAAGQPLQTTSYASVDLHVDGKHWTAVGAGDAACP